MIKRFQLYVFLIAKFGYILLMMMNHFFYVFLPSLAISFLKHYPVKFGDVAKVAMIHMKIKPNLATG
jgi:hypothetical protein